MNILITSGGTIEKIDAVRSISNMSTGKLGSLIADCFAGESNVGRIFYICSSSAIKPQCAKAEINCADSVSSLESLVRELLCSVKFDIIVHCMAVSDYRVASVTSAAALAGLLASNADKIKQLEGSAAVSAVTELLKKSSVDAKGKIDSDEENLFMLMERTPKIISLFHRLSPNSTLIGFKLLDNAPLEILIDKAYKILTQNKCSFVLANDLRDITDELHTGYLIDKNKNYTKYSSKAEIASAIVASALKERMDSL